MMSAVLPAVAQSNNWKKKYTYTTPAEGGFYIVADGKNYGLTDSTGKVLVEPEWDELAAPSGSGVWAWMKADKKGKKLWGRIDFSGKTLILPVYDKVGAFSNGRAVVRIAKEDKKKDGQYTYRSGFIDINGEEVIKAVYDDVRPFQNLKGLVLKDDVWSFVNCDGEPVLPKFQYADILPAGTGKYIIGEGSRQKKKYGLADAEGKKLISPAYRYLFPTQNTELYIAGGDNALGIININGKTVMEPIFEEFRSFSDDYVIIRRNKKYGIANYKEGVISVGCDYVNVVYEDSLIYSVMNVNRDNKTRKWGLIHPETGTLYIPVEYDSLYYINDKVIGFSEKNKWGLLNLKGSRLAEPRYDDLTRAGKFTVIFQKGNKLGILDTTGKELVPAQYDTLRGVYNKTEDLLAFQKKVHGVISRTGKVIIPFEYERIYSLWKPHRYVALKAGNKSFLDSVGTPLTGERLKKAAEDDAAEDTYFSQEPYPLNLIDAKRSIQYPKPMRNANIMGRVIVKILIDKNGSIEKFFFTRSPHPAFTEAVLREVGHLRFIPYRENGQTQRSWVTIPFDFKLR